jgi:hypothetical protein
MKKTLLIPFVSAAAVFLTPLSSQSQTIVQRDPAIVQLVDQVSADSLKAHVEKLVSFGTRASVVLCPPGSGF